RHGRAAEAIRKVRSRAAPGEDAALGVQEAGLGVACTRRSRRARRAGHLRLPRLHPPLGQEPRNWQVGGEDSNGSRPVPSNVEAYLRVVQGASPCPTRGTATRAQPQAPRSLRLLWPQRQRGPVRVAALSCCVRMVALVASSLAARSHLGGDVSAVAALPVAAAARSL